MLTNLGGLSFGEYGEDGGETQHKEIRSDRPNHTRKFSRVATNGDLFKWRMLRTCPLFCHMFKGEREKFKTNTPLPKEVLQLLIDGQDVVVAAEDEDFDGAEFLTELDFLCVQPDENE